jgi:thiol-disulfide isomerase/thioredoxin
MSKLAKCSFRWALGACALLIVASACRPLAAQVSQPPAAGDVLAGVHPFPKRVPAPVLDGDFEWINTTKPPMLSDIRGKFVLLDFWTFCCINCMHILPELKQMERAFPNELVVIGVHSAKFEGEQDANNIREAVERYQIEHPVVNDSELTIWNRYGINTWPTLVLIDPAGEAVWVGKGEKKFAELKQLLDRGLPYYRKQGLLNTAPVTFIAKLEPSTTPLRFPGKVLADEASGRLFIADSNHNRIVITGMDGKLQEVIGSGAAGRKNGTLAECSFRQPQGMALVGENLFVADTENHMLRKVDLAAKRVTTVAGNGQQANAWPPKRGRRFAGPPRSTELNSPWDLLVHGEELYIAMAGPHQIWRMQLPAREIGPYAGNGREDIVDGPLLPSAPYELGSSSFAQPSGLATDGQRLFVADSEGSAIRGVPLDVEGQVETLIGTIGSLFDFGDVDGPAGSARLQHAIGVAYHDGKLYIADTYNNKIKQFDLATRNCETIAGMGQVGQQDADEGKQATFNEPAGISCARNKIYVADTNNHLIRVVEDTPPYRVSTLKIDGLTPPTN